MSNLCPPFDDSVQLQNVATMSTIVGGSDQDLRDVESQNFILPHSADSGLNQTTCMPCSPTSVEDEGDGLKVVRVVKTQPSCWAKCRPYVTIAVLVFINLLNYMDRFTIAGVLNDIQGYYNIDNTESGLLQTAFIGGYMVFSPVFGYLGDRFNRKMLMTCGILFWSLITLASSFIPANHFWAFIIMRALVGIGEASYSTIAPTIVADLFVKTERSKMLALFYFAIPIGSGLGYIVGAKVATALNEWQFALRVTPALGIICVILIIALVREPVRGAAEGGTHLGNTGILIDLKSLAKNKSFVLSSAGFTCVAFVTGALAFWAPDFIGTAYELDPNSEMSRDNVALIFGGITVAAGFIGVATGSTLSTQLKKINPRADPLVCATGLLTCTPFLFLTLIFSQTNKTLTWVFIFLGETLLCLNWAIVADMLLYVVIPTRRSTAEALQIFFSHLLGDAGSPYFIGIVSDALSRSSREPTSAFTTYWTLQYGLYSTCFVAVLGGGFFLATAIFIQHDKAMADRIIKGLKKGEVENAKVLAITVQKASNSNSSSMTGSEDERLMDDPDLNRTGNRDGNNQAGIPVVPSDDNILIQGGQPERLNNVIT